MERWEREVSPHAKDAAVRFFRQLPALWLARLRAARLLARMPEYGGTVGGVDAEKIHGWVREICATPHRRPGTPEGRRAEDWAAAKFRELGLEGVRLDPIPIEVWGASRWSLEVEGRAVPCFFLVHSGFTGPEGIETPLAYVGRGRPRDFRRVNVAGKIAVAEVPFPYVPTGLLVMFLRRVGAALHVSDPGKSLGPGSGQVLNFVRRNFIGGTTAEDPAPAHDVYWQAHRRGARAVCLILRDQPSNANSHYGPYDGIAKPMPGVWVGKYDGAALREAARAGARARLVLEGEARPGTMHNVWGVLPGASPEVVMVTSHHDAPFRGAVEDGTGVAQVLAQARIWSALPRHRRPRTLVFLLNAGHFYGSEGAYHFVREHGDLMKRVRMAITLEHLAAREVEERGQGYAPTGRPALTVMFTSSEPGTMAAVKRALTRKPAPLTVPVPYDLLAPAPTSDAAWFVLKGGVPVISWIGCPYYLLDEHDTLEMVDPDLLGPVCETVTELVKCCMVL